jgi:hypothetical protein
MLLPIGMLLIVVGLAGTAAAFLQSRTPDTPADQPSGYTESLASEAADTDDGGGLALAPIAGVVLATGLVCVGIGIGNWKRPIPSDVRPANPWSDQPGEHGDPPKGLV